jgi:hypothetical protein
LVLQSIGYNLYFKVTHSTEIFPLFKEWVVYKKWICIYLFSHSVLYYCDIIHYRHVE